ncbi:MAG: DUF2267 domain-containing protein [Thermoanaerobaculia bacterium]
MTHDELVGRVQSRAGLPSRGDAERAIRATLESLAERLDGEIGQHLAAQLPQEIGRHLLIDTEFRRLDLDEFFKHVHEREGEGVDLPDSVYHARVVIEVIGEAVSQGAMEKIRSVLPAEFGPLFEGSAGRMRTAAAEQRKGNALESR